MLAVRCCGLPAFCITAYVLSSRASAGHGGGAGDAVLDGGTFLVWRVLCAYVWGVSSGDVREDKVCVCVCVCVWAGVVALCVIWCVQVVHCSESVPPLCASHVRGDVRFTVRELHWESMPEETTG